MPTGISAQFVRFTYYNTAYIVDRDAVLHVESAADGQTVTLTVARGASLPAIQAVAAEDLDRAIPFGQSSHCPASCGRRPPTGTSRRGAATTCRPCRRSWRRSTPL